MGEGWEGVALPTGTTVWRLGSSRCHRKRSDPFRLRLFQGFAIGNRRGHLGQVTVNPPSGSGRKRQG